MSSELEAKSTSFLNSWLSMEQYCQQKKANFPRIQETSGPLAIAVNMGYIPAQSVHEALQANPDEAKTHQGVRTTFFVVKMLYPGWSSVKMQDSGISKKSMSAVSDKAAGAAGGGNKRKEMAEPKEKLSHMVLGEHVAMHSFDLVNQRGTYVRSGKSEECLVLSPGMLLTTKVWGNKFDKTFKEQVTDIHPFDMVLVQFGMHSMQSSSRENGMMLEIKSYNKIPVLNPSAAQILPSLLLPNNMQDASIQRTKFTDASHLSSTTVPGLAQDMLKGNISTSCFFMKFCPNPTNGVFAIGPDDLIKYYVQHPLADIPNTGNMNVVFNAPDFLFHSEAMRSAPSLQNMETSMQYREWVIKLFNVLQIANALEMLIILDTYKKNKSQQQSEDDGTSNLILDAYVRVNVASLVQKIQCSGSAPVSATTIPFMATTFPPHQAKCMAAYCLTQESGLHIAIDLRKMTKKQLEVQPSASPTAYSTSIVMPDSMWERGHSVYLFFEERLVQQFVVPLSSAAAGLDNSKLVLETINISSFAFDNCDFEEDASLTLAQDTSAAAEADAQGSGETQKSKKPKKA